MKNFQKYAKQYFLPQETCLDWIAKDAPDKAPDWCSVDLRDGNQALVEPMDLHTKIEFFLMLVELGFKEIEVGFPAASETEYSFVRTLIEENLVPDGVTIQVLTQARERIIRRTFEAVRGAKSAIIHIYNSISPAQREQVFHGGRAEVKKIADETELEIESFVHGALCYCYSGQCLLSSMLGGRSGNRGRCAQPCRLSYEVCDADKKIVQANGYILSPRDLCTIELLPQLLESGIYSFKIEGRMKTALYVATVARTYRKALDDYQKDPELYRKNMPWYLDQISNCTYRQFTTGFFFGKPDSESQIYDSNTYIKEYTYLGIVGEVKDGLIQIEQRNKFSVGETIEIMKPDGRNVEAKVVRIVNQDGEEQENAPHPKQILFVELSEQADVYDLLRRQEKV